jgi:beta-lactamase class A
MEARALTAAAIALAASLGAEELTPKEAALWAKLERRLGVVDGALDGVLGVAVKDLRTGAAVEIRAHEVFPAASTIKLAILYELYRQAEEGRIDLAGEAVLSRGPRVSGSGVLQWLGDRVRLSWRDLAVLMIGFSDNEAANLLTERLGMEAVNRRLVALGLRQTRLRRRMMDVEAARRGEENLATPAEMLSLLEAVRAGAGLSAERARDLLAVASTPESRTPFRDPMPAGVAVLAKSGQLEGVRCEVAAVALPRRPYVAAVMTSYLKRDADGDAAIREVSAALFDAFDRLDRAMGHGRVIEGR